jgi:hypothetical protein
MDVKELTYLDGRFDRLEAGQAATNAKLDNHLDRIATAETNIHWLKSSTRWLGGLVLAVIGKLAHLTFFT